MSWLSIGHLIKSLICLYDFLKSLYPSPSASPLYFLLSFLNRWILYLHCFFLWWTLVDSQGVPIGVEAQPALASHAKSPNVATRSPVYETFFIGTWRESAPSFSIVIWTLKWTSQVCMHLQGGSDEGDLLRWGSACVGSCCVTGAVGIIGVAAVGLAGTQQRLGLLLKFH